MYKFKKVFVSMAILAVFLGTMGIFAGAAYDTQVGRSFYSISTTSAGYNGKDENLLFRFSSEVETQWNVSITTTQARTINAQLKYVKEYSLDTTVSSISSFEGSSNNWMTKYFVPDDARSYYVCVQEPAGNGVSGYYSFYQ